MRARRWCRTDRWEVSARSPAAAARGESFADAMATVRMAVARIAATEDDLALKRDGVSVIHGRAILGSAREVDVDGARLRCRRMIIATGARPAVPPVEGLRDVDYLTNESVFSLPSLPPRLAVLGGGAVGCELAQGFARLGSAVTVVEAEDRVLPGEEPEASDVVAPPALRTVWRSVPARPLSASRPSTTAAAFGSGSTLARSSRPTGCWWPWAVALPPTGWASPRSASAWTSAATSAPTRPSTPA